MKILTKFLPHPPYTSDLASSDYWLFADLRKMFRRIRFDTNKEVIPTTVAYFKKKAKGQKGNDFTPLQGGNVTPDK